MNKSDLISAIANSADISSAKAEKVVAAILETISNTLSSGQNVSLVGFGNFGTKERAARPIKNPKTKEIIQINAATVPYFKAGKNLKDLLNSNE